MQTVAIVDYGMGNVGSVARALEECGGDPLITDDHRELAGAERIVLPGVGAFGEAMTRIRSRGLDRVLGDLVLGDGMPFLGLCLGMQLLASRSAEGGDVAGLGWLPGDVRKLQPQEPKERVPHVGWNQVMAQRSSALYEGIPAAADFYFVHSYHFVPEHRDDVLTCTPYCGGVVSSVSRENIWGVQFHPEKSQHLGLRLLRNFLHL